jgi:hypothetical protein
LPMHLLKAHGLNFVGESRPLVWEDPG